MTAWVIAWIEADMCWMAGMNSLDPQIVVLKAGGCMWNAAV